MTAAATTVRRSRLRRFLKEDSNPRRALTALGIAVLTVMATVVTSLQQDASVGFARAQREVDRLSTNVAGETVESLFRAGRAYGGYRAWLEQGYRRAYSTGRVEDDPGNPDRKLWETLGKADTSIETWARTTSPLLQPPYFDETVNNADFDRWFAEQVAGPLLGVRERRDAEALVAQEWSTRSASYVTILTLVAVALFFMGLSTTLSGRAAPLVAVAGLAFGVAAGGWTVLVAAAPVQRIPDRAIERVTAAQSILSEVFSSREGAPDFPPAARARYEEAIRTVDESLAAHPGYDAAVRTRAEIQGQWSGDMLLTVGRSAETDRLAQGSAGDFRRYLEAHPDDYTAWWNLGYALYLADDMAASRAATDEAIQRAPDQFPLYFNRALAKLAMGDRTGADADVEAGLTTAAAAPFDSNSQMLATIDAELGRYAARRPAEAADLLRYQRRVREAGVSLRVLDAPTPRADAPQLGEVRIVTMRMLPNGTLREGVEVRPGTTIRDPDAVGFRVRVTGEASGSPRTLSLRLYRDGTRDETYGEDVPWSPVDGTQTIDLLAPYGRTGVLVTPGAYHLEMYLDGATRMQADWVVPPVAPAFEVSAAELRAELERDGGQCEGPAPNTDPVEGEAPQEISCAGSLTREGVAFSATIGTDDTGALRSLYVSVEAASGPVAADAREFYASLLARIYGESRAAETRAWLERQTEEAYHVITIAGSTLGVQGEGEGKRYLYITV